MVRMRVMVAGSSGLIGKGIVASLKGDGHDVVRLVRRPATAKGELTWHPDRDELDPALVSTVDVAINLCGVNIGDKRWDDQFKRLLRSSRLNPTRVLSRAIAAAHPRPSVLLNASAIGYYGDRGDEVLTEDSGPGTGFFADLCQAWEASTQAAEEAGVRVALMRNGLVLSKGEGLLGRLLPLFKLGIAGNLASGRQYMPCISLSDTVGAMRFLIDNDIAGAVNVVGPEPVTNSEFTKTLGALVHRPTVLPVPRFALRAVAGELANDALRSARVVPALLTQVGYRFQHPTFAAALEAALTPNAPRG
jgi:uncharacterized protein (TIGR01777 family)